ncbi:zinc dependent phospholipase C family protein [Isachenkonia alkalipeptolytica]|uniref:zinc dependent phospholipase C family protein n=1 Tax=Isachenkonia alkalipeptolytica TaxID=2565777 RepID=UPI0013709121|nr:zinc dependent phospholipase C family protein [Isachenkonia alkalipeptolytica]
MLPQTHMIIANHIYDHTEKTLGIRLNKSSLQYGSIKPDIAPNLLKLHHFKPQSLRLICEEIKELTEHTYADDHNYIKFISRQIGIINHFVSDFFCVPHNDRTTYKNNFMEHMAYENTLHKRFKTFDKKIPTPVVSLDFLNLSIDDIEELIEGYHREYSKKVESMSNDIEYSIHVSSLVSVLIMTNMVHKSSIQTSWKSTPRLIPKTA